MNFFSLVIRLLKETAAKWTDDKAPQLGAALAFYTVFSFAPLLLLLLLLIGALFQTDQFGAWTKITQEMNMFLDERAVQAVESIALKAAEPGKGALTTVVGIALAVFGASGVFGQLQDALNTIWNVKAKPTQGIWGFLRARFISFAMVAGVCFILLVSLSVETLIQAMSYYLQATLPGGKGLAFVLYFMLDFGTVTVMFAAIFKFVPDAEIRWRDVWTGSCLTAGFFLVGKWALGLYLAKSANASTYGAASAVITLLLWVYYSSQILLFGAEFTRIYSRWLGNRVVASEFAVRVKHHEVEV